MHTIPWVSCMFAKFPYSCMFWRSRLGVPVGQLGSGGEASSVTWAGFLMEPVVSGIRILWYVLSPTCCSFSPSPPLGQAGHVLGMRNAHLSDTGAWSEEVPGPHDDQVGLQRTEIGRARKGPTWYLLPGSELQTEPRVSTVAHLTLTCGLESVRGGRQESFWAHWSGRWEAQYSSPESHGFVFVTKQSSELTACSASLQLLDTAD